MVAYSYQSHICKFHGKFPVNENWLQTKKMMMEKFKKLVKCSEAVVRYLTAAPYILCSEISEAVVRRCSIKNGVLKHFAKFTGKLFRSLFFKKVPDLRPATSLKKGPQTQMFSCKFGKISKITSFF